MTTHGRIGFDQQHFLDFRDFSKKCWQLSEVVRHRDIGKRWKTKNSKVVMCKCTTVELFEQTKGVMAPKSAKDRSMGRTDFYRVVKSYGMCHKRANIQKQQLNSPRIGIASGLKFLCIRCCCRYGLNLILLCSSGYLLYYYLDSCLNETLKWPSEVVDPVEWKLQNSTVPLCNCM